MLVAVIVDDDDEVELGKSYIVLITKYNELNVLLYESDDTVLADVLQLLTD